jgi:hypothetical protein
MPFYKDCQNETPDIPKENPFVTDHDTDVKFLIDGKFDAAKIESFNFPRFIGTLFKFHLKDTFVQQVTSRPTSVYLQMAKARNFMRDKAISRRANGQSGGFTGVLEFTNSEGQNIGNVTLHYANPNVGPFDITLKRLSGVVAAVLMDFPNSIKLLDNNPFAEKYGIRSGTWMYALAVPGIAFASHVDPIKGAALVTAMHRFHETEKAKYLANKGILSEYRETVSPLEEFCRQKFFFRNQEWEGGNLMKAFAEEIADEIITVGEFELTAGKAYRSIENDNAYKAVLNRLGNAYVAGALQADKVGSGSVVRGELSNVVFKPYNPNTFQKYMDGTANTQLSYSIGIIMYYDAELSNRYSYYGLADLLNWMHRHTQLTFFEYVSERQQQGMSISNTSLFRYLESLNWEKGSSTAKALSFLHKERMTTDYVLPEDFHWSLEKVRKEFSTLD